MRRGFYGELNAALSNIFVNLLSPSCRGDNGHSGEPVLCKRAAFIEQTSLSLLLGKGAYPMKHKLEKTNIQTI